MVKSKSYSYIYFMKYRASQVFRFLNRYRESQVLKLQNRFRASQVLLLLIGFVLCCSCSFSVFNFVFFLQEAQKEPDLDLLQQVLSQSDIDMDQDQTASDMDDDFEQPSTSKEGPQVVLSPDKFRIRDKDDEEEHNEARHNYV